MRVPLSQPLTHAWFSGRKRFAAVFGLKRDVISVADLEVGQALTAEVPSWVVVTAAGLTLGVTVASLGVLPDSHVNYDAGFFFPTSRAASVARVAAYNPFKHPSVTKTFGSVAGWRASAANPRKTPWRG